MRSVGRLEVTQCHGILPLCGGWRATHVTMTEKDVRYTVTITEYDGDGYDTDAKASGQRRARLDRNCARDGTTLAHRAADAITPRTTAARSSAGAVRLARHSRG